MKIYLHLSFVFCCVSLLGMKRTGEHLKITQISFIDLPIEIKQEILFDHFIKECNPLYRSATLEKVCKQFYEMVSMEPIASYIKQAQKENAEFLKEVKKDRSRDYAFIKLHQFDAHYCSYYICYLIKTDPNVIEDLVNNKKCFKNKTVFFDLCMNRDNLFLNESSINVILDSFYACNCQNSQNKNVQKYNGFIDYIIKNRPDIIRANTRSFFKEIIECCLATCICVVKKIVPHLNVDDKTKDDNLFCLQYIPKGILNLGKEFSPDEIPEKIKKIDAVLNICLLKLPAMTIEGELRESLKDVISGCKDHFPTLCTHLRDKFLNKDFFTIQDRLRQAIQYQQRTNINECINEFREIDNELVSVLSDSILQTFKYHKKALGVLTVQLNAKSFPLTKPRLMKIFDSDSDDE